MMKILLQKLMKKDSQVRNILKKNNLSQKELNENITGLVPELGQDREAAEWFEQFSDYVYRATFSSEINGRDRKEAYLLYRKLREKLNKG